MAATTDSKSVSERSESSSLSQPTFKYMCMRCLEAEGNRLLIYRCKSTAGSNPAAYEYVTFLVYEQEGFLQR